MAPAIAVDLLFALAAEQQARNTIFPEAVDSPVVYGSAAAVCHQLIHVLEFAGCPWDEVPAMRAITTHLSCEIAATLGPASHADFQFLTGYQRPVQSETNNAMHQLEVELIALRPRLLRWRLALAPARAARWDAVVEGLCVSLFEVSYFGTFSFLELLASSLRRLQMGIEEALAEPSGPAP